MECPKISINQNGLALFKFWADAHTDHICWEWYKLAHNAWWLSQWNSNDLVFADDNNDNSCSFISWLNWTGNGQCICCILGCKYNKIWNVSKFWIPQIPIPNLSVLYQQYVIFLSSALSCLLCIKSERFYLWIAKSSLQGTHQQISFLSSKLQTKSACRMINNGGWTEWSAIWSEIIGMI